MPLYSPRFQLLVDCVNAVTGWDLDIMAAVRIGRRVVNRLRIFNLLHGLDPALEWPSPRYGATPGDGPLAGVSILDSFAAMRQTYWRYMGWDEAAGRPLPGTLAELGLQDWIAPLWEGRSSRL